MGGAQIAGLVALTVVVVMLVVKFMWKVPEADEALIITGFGAHHGRSAEPLDFRIVTGGGVLVVPWLQTMRRLAIGLERVDLALDTVTADGIPLRITGSVIYSVGHDRHSIGEASRRFVDRQADMSPQVEVLFRGHLRSIVGTLTVPQIIRDRAKLTQLTRDSSGHEMENLGFIVDSMQVDQIEGPPGYLDDLPAPAPAITSIVLRTGEPDRAREFYMALGFDLTAEQHGTGPRHVAAEVAGLVVELYPLRAGEIADQTTQIGITVANLADALASLERLGARVQRRSGSEATATDPDGRAIRLMTSAPREP